MNAQKDGDRAALDFVVTQRAIYEADASKNKTKRDRAVPSLADAPT